MARRCDSCQKFASLEEGDPELEGEVEVTDDTVSADVRLTRNCADCGDELLETTFSLEEHPAILGTTCEPTDELAGDDKHHTWEAGEFEPMVTDRYDDKGGKIKAKRFMKRMIGVEGTVTLTCTKCQTTTDVTLKAETSASSFDDC